MNQKRTLSGLVSKLTIILGIILSVIVLCMVFIRSDVTAKETIDVDRYVRIRGYQTEELIRDDAPLGIVKVYHLDLTSLLYHDASLFFYSSHQNIDVYVDDAHIYSLKANPESNSFKTVGGTWTSIPLIKDEYTKSVRIELTPIYEIDRNQQIDFLLGSKYAIFMDQLLQDLPQLIISLVLIILGFILVLIAIFWIAMKKAHDGLLPLGLAACSMGLWQMCDAKIAPMIAPGLAVPLFYGSILFLIMTATALGCIIQQRYKTVLNGFLERYLNVSNLLTVAILLLQILGIADLRTLQPLILLLMIIGCVVVTGVIFYDQAILSKKTGNAKIKIFPVFLGIGIGIDIIVFFFRHSTFSIEFTMFALVCYIFYSGLRFFMAYNEQANRLSEKEVQLTQSRITVLLSQIRSHFVFNILNAISGMCKYDPEKADETVVYFARYLRTNIDIMQDDQPVTFHSALRHVEDYVRLEQIRFGDQIRFETDIEADRFLIPPLILQPIVENAIRHGILPKHSGGTVTLRTRREDDFIRVEVHDDGVGFDTNVKARAGSVGLKNVRFRLQHMMNGSMHIESTPGSGTTVTYLIPRKEAENADHICG